MAYGQQQDGRIPFPRGKEVLGIVDEMLGGSRFRVRCIDQKERICRIPGKSKRGVWVKVADLVLIEPWDIEPNEKGDILFRYTRTQVEQLRRKGIRTPV